MTSENKNRQARDKLVEDVLDTVQSIDKNVEEILDRLGDHLEGMQYRTSWGHDHYEDAGD